MKRFLSQGKFKHSNDRKIIKELAFQILELIFSTEIIKWVTASLISN